MPIEQIGKANADDQPELHRLWETVFGDPPELVQAFFDRFPPEISGWVLRHDGKICSAAYLIPGNWYINRSEMQPAAYVYAVATDPKMRGKGFGGQLMQKISAFAEERGLLLYTRPAEQSLFSWYETQMNAKNIGHLHTHHFNALSTIANLPCRRITPLEYGAARLRGQRESLSSAPGVINSECRNKRSCSNAAHELWSAAGHSSLHWNCFRFSGCGICWSCSSGSYKLGILFGITKIACDLTN